MLALGCKITDRKAKHHVDVPYGDGWCASVGSGLVEEAGNLLYPLISEGFTKPVFADVVKCGFLPCGPAEMQGNCALWCKALCCPHFAVPPVPLSLAGFMWMPWILMVSCFFLWLGTNSSVSPLHAVMQGPCTHILERPVLRGACPGSSELCLWVFGGFVSPGASTLCQSWQCQPPGLQP